MIKKWLADLFDRSFWAAAFPLVIPIALQNLLMTSFRLVDTLMVGRLGDVSIAAVGLAGWASFLVELLAFGMSSGAAVFVAQYHGANNKEDILRTYGMMLSFMIPLGLVFTVGVGLFPGFVMRLFTDDAALISEGVRYLQFACISYLSLTVNLAISTMLRCTEQVKIPMITSGIAAGLNAILNYIFIFGVFGFPAMGVAGAGLATAISSLINPILMLMISMAKKNIVIAPLSQIFALKGFYKTFWSRALPVLLNEFFWSLSVVGINMVLGRMGTDNYAALTVERTIEGLAFVFFVGVCNACNILVGKSIGAGNIEQGKMYARRFLGLAPLMGAALGLIIVSLRYPLIGLFDLSETAKHTARTLLVIFAIDAAVRYIPYIEVVGIFRAGGETRFGLLTDVISQYVFIVPTVVLCGLVWKLPFITTYILMLVADDVSKLVLTIPYYRTMRWIKPIQQAGVTDREEILIESGGDPVL
ncbi:putative FMN/FAD exporter YeeO [bioreactor metagenome]|uniref:Multidrug-efflux transporter n=1 Tax=bioreactor metagenome TaxID=1076179 RepID=A0A644ZSZ2_9ZZZZ|nr:MATE family efflux transporter [Christensenella sp.]